MEFKDQTNKDIQKELLELQKAYNELQIKEQRYRFLAENARDVIWTMKIDGTITYISPAVEQLRGFTVEEAMNQPIDEIITPASQLMAYDYMVKLNKAFAAGLPLPNFQGEYEYYCKDGSTLWTEVFVYPLHENDTGSLIMVGVTRDITERRLLKEEILNQNTQLAELNATKDKFFGIIAHDLRNPFIGIVGLSELIRDSKQDRAEKTEKYVNLIHQSAKNASRLLENLLDWSKAQTGAIEFEPKEFSLQNLVKDVINLVENTAKAKTIAIKQEVPDGLNVFADSNMINTVLRNLITNAIKFTNKNGNILITATQQNSEVSISIKDSGVGMSEKAISNLFKISEKTSTLGTENESGTGLGLMLCKEFIEKHNAKISVESEVGKGSTFTFTLPTR